MLSFLDPQALCVCRDINSAKSPWLKLVFFVKIFVHIDNEIGFLFICKRNKLTLLGLSITQEKISLHVHGTVRGGDINWP